MVISQHVLYRSLLTRLSQLSVHRVVNRNVAAVAGSSSSVSANGISNGSGGGGTGVTSTSTTAPLVSPITRTAKRSVTNLTTISELSHVRHFSSSGGDDSDGINEGEKPTKQVETDTRSSLFDNIDLFNSQENYDPHNMEETNDADPFGIFLDDGKEGLGSSATLPPLYKRDSVTGKMTGKIQSELSYEDKRIINADPIEKRRFLQRRMEKHAQASTEESLDTLGRRIRVADMGLNVLGRSPVAQSQRKRSDPSTSLSQPLTPSEYSSFKSFMGKAHKTTLQDDDISKVGRGPMDVPFNPDQENLALKWLTARAKRQMNDSLDENPYSDLVPGDLNPRRLVNRRRAKKIPVELMHHNNVDLLRRFMTPSQQIATRVQTRLGARDQRRVARLVKRARAMGLLPYNGQMKVEHHGWMYEEDIMQDRPWEAQLKEHGLVIQNQAKKDSRGDPKLLT